MPRTVHHSIVAEQDREIAGLIRAMGFQRALLTACWSDRDIAGFISAMGFTEAPLTAYEKRL